MSHFNLRCEKQIRRKHQRSCSGRSMRLSSANEVEKADDDSEGQEARS
jgi:hypothetical protein